MSGECLCHGIAERSFDPCQRGVAQPVCCDTLSGDARSARASRQSDIEVAHRIDGVPAAMALFARLVGLGAIDREPDVDLPGPGPYRAANLEYFLTYDAPAVRRYQPDPSALRAESAAIAPALGEATSGVAAGCAPAPADLGVDAVRFPGGHAGPRMYPRGYAERLRALFAPEQRA